MASEPKTSYAHSILHRGTQSPLRLLVSGSATSLSGPLTVAPQVGRRHIKGKGPMETFLLKHGDWEVALRALQAQTPQPLERSESVPVITELSKEVPLSLLKQTIRRRSKVETELQAAKALERTGSAPGNLEEIAGDVLPGKAGDGERISDRKELGTKVESTDDNLSLGAAQDSGNGRSAPDPLPNKTESLPTENAPVAEPGLPTEEPVDRSPSRSKSRKSHIESLRIHCPVSPVAHPSYPRPRSPLSRSYSSPDLKVLIRRESMHVTEARASYPEETPSSTRVSDADARLILNPSPSTSPSASPDSKPLNPDSKPLNPESPRTGSVSKQSSPQRRVSDSTREFESHSRKFVQVGKTAWVLKRPSPMPRANKEGGQWGLTEAVPVAKHGNAETSNTGEPVADLEKSAPPDARSQRLRDLLGSDPSSYVRRLSDTSLVTDLEAQPDDAAHIESKPATSSDVIRTLPNGLDHRLPAEETGMVSGANSGLKVNEGGNSLSAGIQEQLAVDPGSAVGSKDSWEGKRVADEMEARRLGMEINGVANGDQSVEVGHVRASFFLEGWVR
jgi:hypothetical protein